MQKLALHQITMMDGGAEGLVRFAAGAGLDRVCLFTATPVDGDGRDIFPIVQPDKISSFNALLRDLDVQVINAEYFPVMAGQDVSEYRPAVALAADLRAKRIVTHIHEPDANRAADQLTKLCAMARDHGLDVGLEFTGFAAGCNSLTSAVALHGRVNQSNLTIAIDALHLFRTGGTLDQLRSVDPSIIGYAQLCDGPDFRQSDDYLQEAMNRMLPGAGVFPLKSLVQMLGPHVDIDIEIPDFARSAQSDPFSWAYRAITASRNLWD